VTHPILAHPRLADIAFDKDAHIYTYKNGTKFKGVTGWIGEYKKPFERDKMSKAVAYRTGRTQEEVLDEWDTNLAASQVYGNGVHDAIEQLILTGAYDDTYGQELDNFLLTMTQYDLTPVACELTVYNEDINRASNIDLLCTRGDEIVVVDFKTPEKGIKFEAYKNQKMLYPINILDDCSFIHYSLQLDIYAYWLEQKYGMNVASDKWILYLRADQAEMYISADVREQTLKLHEWELSKQK
jgi:ATP-dependent exoDNAse (exonuclease V) beta subunit